MLNDFDSDDSFDFNEEDELLKSQYYFPFQPYPTQLNLMKQIYQILDNGKIGIIESPTGTGKSLMLICSSLQWLLDHHQKLLKGQATKSFNDDASNINESEKVKSTLDPELPEWLQSYALNHSKTQAQRDYEQIQDLIKESLERDEAELRRYRASQSQGYGNNTKRFKKEHVIIHSNEGEDDEYLLDEYYESNNKESNTMEHSAADKVKELMLKFEAIEQEYEDNQILSKSEDQFQNLNFTKIYYATRTHSQLSQFISELTRTEFGKKNQINCTPLVSRKTFCINDTVRKSCRDQVDLINDKCSDLQSSSTLAKNRCAYYLPNDRPRLIEFQQETMKGIQNIEDLVTLGQKRGICPYYGTKKSSKYAHLIPIPYTMLLSKSTREEANIHLKGNIVIIDEAHNLIDTIESVHSISFTIQQVVSTLEQVEKYLEKYRNRLKGQNIVFLKQILLLLNGWKDLFKSDQLGVKVLSSTELGFRLKLDQVNGFSLIKYLKESKLANKLNGFTNQVLLKDPAQRSSMNNIQSSSRTHIHNLCTLLECLGYPSSDGRVIITNTKDEQKLEYQLIDPSRHFETILQEARSVIMIGGTMQPMEDFTQQLCGIIPKERITTITSGHVVSSSNVSCMTISKGPTGKEFKFTFDNQHNLEMIDELGRTILNTCNLIPHGLVVFFQSYKMMEKVLEKWKKLSQSQPSLFELISKKKRVFIEPTNANRVDNVLESYASWIAKCKDRKGSDPIFDGHRGALLLSVMGGKLSEGINFSDELGRGVIVVGLPFPNKTSIKLQQKLTWLDQLEQIGAKKNSVAYYENLCMRTVNQSIGRVIRHKNDYATIILIDSRYSQQNIIYKLPDWIKASLLNNGDQSHVGITEFGKITRNLAGFFNLMRQQHSN